MTPKLIHRRVIFSRRAWRDAMDALGRARLIPTPTCMPMLTGDGQVVRRLGADDPPHAWQLSARWDDDLERWQVTARAGFVNDEPACVVDEDGELRRLTEVPWMTPVSWCRIGGAAGDADAPPVTEFFRERGVRDKPGAVARGEDFAVPGAGFADVDVLPDERWLWGVDVRLVRARSGLQGDITVVDGSGASGQVVSYTPRLGTSPMMAVWGDAAVVQTVRRYKEPEVPSLADRLTGAYLDPQEDQLYLGTVYLLSPPVETMDGEELAAAEMGPPASCEVWCGHEVFHNLTHASRGVRFAGAEPITLFTGLVGGLADVIFNQMLAPGNDDYERVLSALTGVDPEGRFWTC